MDSNKWETVKIKSCIPLSYQLGKTIELFDEVLMKLWNNAQVSPNYIATRTKGARNILQVLEECDEHRSGTRCEFNIREACPMGREKITIDNLTYLNRFAPWYPYVRIIPTHLVPKQEYWFLLELDELLYRKK